jgi:hypothetical protein
MVQVDVLVFKIIPARRNGTAALFPACQRFPGEEDIACKTGIFTATGAKNSEGSG